VTVRARTRLLAVGTLGAAGIAAAVALSLSGRPPAPVHPPRAPARAGARPPPNRWGGPLVAAPLVSRGRPVASRPRGGDVLVDGVYRTRATWAGGHPTPEAPSWAAIDVGPGFTRLLVSWTSSGNHD
jgi:acyl-CoA thioesterase-1